MDGAGVVSSGLSRRAVVGAGVWAAPVLVVSSAVPAFAAASDQRVVSVSVAGGTVPAEGAVTLSVTVTSPAGAGLAGVGVSLLGPLGSIFGASNGVTNGSGVFSTTFDLGRPWAMPGSTVVVSALSGISSGEASLTVVGSNLVAAGVLYGATPVQTERVFSSPVVQAVAGGIDVNAFVLAVLENGSVWAKGNNSWGQLGDGTSTSRTTWAPVSGLSGVTQVAAAYGACYALLSDGSVRAWGRNHVGQLGDGSTTGRLVPVVVSGLSGVTTIAAGHNAGYALLSDGSVRAWGSNDNGQLGDGTTTNRVTPVVVSGLSGVTQIAGNTNAAYALLSDGSVRAWGRNASGELGDGTGTNRSLPVTVSGLTSGVTQIAAGGYSGYALLSDGSVKAWGYNLAGQLGDGTTTQRLAPVVVSGLAGVSQIAAADRSAFALLSGGTVKSWGRNNSYELGDGTTTSRTVPVSMLVPAGHEVERIGSGASAYTPLLVIADGTVSVDVLEGSVEAGSAGTVEAMVSSGSVTIAGALVSLSATGNAVLGASSGVTGASGVFQTTVTPDVWTPPGASVQVTARSDANSASDSFSVLGSNVVASGVLYSATVAQAERVFPLPVLQAVSSFYIGWAFAFVLLEDGTVWAKGRNGNGELGDGTRTDRSTWAVVPGLSGVIQIAGGYRSGYALLSDGSIKAWGANSDGQLGSGTRDNWLTPGVVSGVSGVTQIAVGGSSAYALRSDGSVVAWGNNVSGQLGDGTITGRAQPLEVSQLSGVSQIAAAAASAYALLSDGSVKAWGDNTYGKLGDGSTINRLTPVSVSGLTGVEQIAAGGHSAYAIRSNGSVWAWGRNDNGQVGNGSTQHQAEPVAVSGLTSEVTQIEGGYAAAYALLSDGTVRAWGRGTEGQLGDGGLTDRGTPVSVPVPQGRLVKRIGAGAASYTPIFTVADWSVSVDVVESQVTAGTTGTVKAKVSSGSVGVAGASVSLSATAGAELTASTGVTDASGVFQTTVTPDVWTRPGSSVLATAANGANSSSDSFSVVGSNLVAAGVLYGATPVQTERVFSSPVVQAVAGGIDVNAFVLAVLENGSVWAKGNNSWGQLGDGTSTSRTTWAPVSGLSGVTQVAAAYGACYALLSDGSVRAWGRNHVGQLGDGSTTGRLVPVVVSGLSGVTTIAAGHNAGYALLSDGSVRAWGSNDNGQLGDGTTTNRVTPVVVSGLSGVTQIAGNTNAAYALLSDGSVRAWGRNASGELGDGTGTNRSLPVTVSGLTSGVTQIAAGGYSGYALLSDGSVKAWGYNLAGQLGDGTTTQRLAPVVVSGLAGVSQIAAADRSAFALLSGGTVKSWGRNNSYELGDGTTTSRTVPVSMLVPAGHEVERIGSGASAYTPLLVT